MTSQEAVRGKIHVIKRNGKIEDVNLAKMTWGIAAKCYNLDMNYVNPSSVANKVIDDLSCDVTTIKLNDSVAKIAAAMGTLHPDYLILAARICVSNLYKNTKKSFSEVMRDLYYAKNPITDKPTPVISKHYYNIVRNNADRLDSAIQHYRDTSYNYICLKTLERRYLLKINGKIVERPQHLFMRVSIGINENDIEKTIETYNYLSEGYFIHATPTLYNACTNQQQMSNCFLLTLDNDNAEAVGDTLNQFWLLNKCDGEIALDVHNVRASSAKDMNKSGTNAGLIPVLNLYNNTPTNETGNKRSRVIAIYLEAWHANILDFLRLTQNIGGENRRARNLFCGLWIPDLFMERVRDNQLWSLMCPEKAPGLADVWGTEFNNLYIRYEREQRYKQQVEASTLFMSIVNTQKVTGIPSMLYKDNCNKKSNHQHLGTIKCSSLSTEIIQYSGPREVAVCNLASIAVNKFVNTNDKTFDFDKLKTVAKIVTRNLNKLIDVNFYPLPETKTSNQRHRPIGVGIQGLADAFLLMRYPFESEEAKELNKKIFETLYYGALEASCELAAEKGSYETYEGSPVSKGILQYDMWGVNPTDLWDWDELKAKIAQHGVRNSLLIAAMPTATTAHILGNSECFQPYTSNVMKSLAEANHCIINPHLIRDLITKNLWNTDMITQLFDNIGSVQKIDRIPDDLKALYKTAWEIPQQVILQMAADRGAFIDQSQSLSFHVDDTTDIAGLHIHSWEIGLKTGMYHLRMKPDPEANRRQLTV